MKKLFALLMLFILLITACTSPHSPLDEETTIYEDDSTAKPTGTQTTTPQENMTSIPSESETTIQSESETTIQPESETTGFLAGSPGPFSDTMYIKNTSDFYTLLKTKSTNPDDYEEPIRKLVNCVRQIPEANVLITLEDAGIKKQELLDKHSGVELGFKTDYDGDYYLYYYSFENGSTITVKYFPEMYPGINESNLHTMVTSRTMINEGGFLAWYSAPESVNQHWEYDNLYWEYIDGCLVYYYSYIYKPGIKEVNVCVLIDEFSIEVCYFENESKGDDMSDYGDFLKYFSEDTYQEAIQQLIANVRNRE